MTTIPTLAEAKAYMRIDADYTFDDVLIQEMLDAAIDWCEKYTGLAFTRRQFTQYSDKNYFDLQFYPVVSVDSVLDSDGDAVYYSRNANTSRIVPGWPGVNVTYTAGYDVGELPSNLKIAVLMFTNTIYENREDFVISNFRTFANTLPISVKELLGLHTRSAGLFL